MAKGNWRVRVLFYIPDKTSDFWNSALIPRRKVISTTSA
jgi:hypothetical protein